MWAMCLLFTCTLPITLVSADEITGGEPWPQRCANIRTSYNPDADLQTDALTLTPDNPCWPAFLAWVKEQQLFTSTLVGFTAGESSDSGAGIIVRWAANTAWETTVIMPWGQALAHIIAERNWRDVDFPEFFAERGGLYNIDLAERLAMLDAQTHAPWQLFLETVSSPTSPTAPLLQARLSKITQDGQTAEITFGPDRTVTYSAERLLLDLRTFLTDCQIHEFFQTYDQPGSVTSAASETPQPPSAENGQVIYERECLGCHGENGDGQGLLATTLAPRPRDFTRGLFRYRSTPTGQLPTDDDLQRTISHGLTGGSMPAFRAFLDESEIRDVVAYLKQFSPRFEQEQTPQPVTVIEPPPPPPERITHGAQLYQDSGCPSCHGGTGKGDGRSGQDLKTSEGDPITPRNLTHKWSFRGGHTPHDVFLRLAAGMDGSSMASYGDALTTDELWDVVFYVLTLSPQERPQAHTIQ
jgi:mono/diheme cytochrome c family protein